MIEGVEDHIRELRRMRTAVESVIEERVDLLTAISDLLDFQRLAIDLLSRIAGTGTRSHERQIDALIDSFRRPSPAIQRVRAKAIALAAAGSQTELPLSPNGVWCCSLCKGQDGLHAPHCPSSPSRG